MNSKKNRLIITYIIAAIWLVNGLFCKILTLVPRHEQIVARILGNGYAHTITILIGVAETGMAAWILSGKWSRLNAMVQIAVVITMNMLEFILAPDLLLWGKMNALFALILVLVVYYNEFKPAIKNSS
jgi:DoxX-like family